MSTTAPTTEDRLNAAFNALRTQGVTVNFNVEECCRSCATAGMKGERIVWTYAGQVTHFLFINGEPHEDTWVEEDCDYCVSAAACNCDLTLRLAGRPTPAEELFVYFLTPGGAGSEDLARAAVKALTDQGLTVEWDGSASSAVLVLF
ncbi:hypothetical protein [Nesterenkonia rhizosphaerae]